MGGGLPKIPLRFYRTRAGGEPVREWLRAMDRGSRLTIGADLQRAQYRWPVGMPLCRPPGGGLWEIRSHLPDKTISRVLVCLYDGELVALNGFVKKTRTTPAEEMDLARSRKKEIERDE